MARGKPRAYRRYSNGQDIRAFNFIREAFERGEATEEDLKLFGRGSHLNSAESAVGETGIEAPFFMRRRQMSEMLVEGAPTTDQQCADEEDRSRYPKHRDYAGKDIPLVTKRGAVIKTTIGGIE